ncbi:MAG: tetratricopeptide repeat protein [bacterium]|nr:tetratricopeptide repeat protein [bacterium]
MNRTALCMFAALWLCASCGGGPKAALDAARADLDAGRPTQALAAYERIAEARPYCLDAIGGAAKAARICGVTEADLRWSRELLQYRPWDRDANLSVGRALMREGDYKNAANRLMLAWLDSQFKQDKEEARDALIQLHLAIRSASPDVNEPTP